MHLVIFMLFIFMFPKEFGFFIIFVLSVLLIWFIGSVIYYNPMPSILIGLCVLLLVTVEDI